MQIKSILKIAIGQWAILSRMLLSAFLVNMKGSLRSVPHHVGASERSAARLEVIGS